MIRGRFISSFLILFLFIFLISGCAPKDTTLPQVSIISPKNGDTVSGIVKIHVQVIDNTGINKVEFYIDGSKVSEISSAPYTYDWNTWQTSNGDHTIIVKAKDKEGNVGSDSIVVEVNNPWQKTYGGSYDDWANFIQQTSDKGYIVAGGTYSFSAGTSDDVYILKLDSNGNLEWEKTFGGNSYDWANSIQQASDGGYIVAGMTNSFGAGGFDVYILKLDSNGNLEWEKTFDENSYDWANSIQQASDGGYIVAGMTNSFGAGGFDV
ncbi:MAG: Ig-like domain-containing protein, partial [Dictyoglomaceae bacterium]